MEENESKKPTRKRTRTGNPQKSSSGLGDTVEKITTATGIKAAVDWFSEQTGIDCGCDARKEKLNQIFRYRKPECLKKDEYEFIGSIIGKNVITASQQSVINNIYNRVFRDNVQATNCGSCLAGRVQELGSLYNVYDKQGS